MDAVPGKVNETWFKADRTGIYYGECSELCGTDHAFMPIEIDVVTQDQFNAWVLGHKGTLKGQALGSGAGAEPRAPAPSSAGSVPLGPGAATTAAPTPPTANTTAAVKVAAPAKAG